MEIDQWPVVERTQLVQTFRLGESEIKEAPFRTLRNHGWATSGVSVVTRAENHASGRLTLYSVLNVDAARLAREGDVKGASALAKVATKVEASDAFVRLRVLLSGRLAKDVSAAVGGAVEENQWPELHVVLRTLARETKAARANKPSNTKLPEVVVGRISIGKGDYLILTTSTGVQTAVPRWLAQSAHRENVGDCLALVTERLGAGQLVIKAMPAIDVGAESPEASFSPFGRSASVRDLTPADARLLSRTPAPLRILVPVTISS